MGQNDFFKMTELSVNEVELSVNETELSTNAAEFLIFQKITVPFTCKTRFDRILTNFTEFSKNRQDQPPPNFFVPHKFSNIIWVCTTALFCTGSIGMYDHSFVPCE
jgi:hypothetical protein